MKDFGPSCHPATTGDSSTDSMRRQSDRLVKEIAILRKTVEEMEIRIDTQKQTLCARDESIKKLLEMLQVCNTCSHWLSCIMVLIDLLIGY